MIDSENEAVEFLTRTTFGPTGEEIEALVGRDASDWFQAQLNVPATLVKPRLLAMGQRNEDVEWYWPSALTWNNMITADDQLRQRMALALSQILVVSEAEGSVLSGQPLTVAEYMDILNRNAFGNYRDLLEEVTYSVAMAQYLTYLRNRPDNPKTGEVPDENYAREIMQLFTIGLVELNPDGTARTGVDGRPIPTYDNADVAGLARVFTGLSFDEDEFWSWPPAEDSWHTPLRAFPENHSGDEKRFLGTVISPGTGPDESIDTALDTLFNHPNTAPFISRQLIQRFTTSDPDPAYVGRVATAFDEGRFTLPNGDSVGTGERGDLAATLASVLFDESVADLEADMPETFGKVREPVIRFTQWARAFDAAPVAAENEWRLWNTGRVESLSQHPYRSPSVFNFYRPGYVSPGTETGAAGLTAPELQIVNEASAIGYMDFITGYIRNQTGTVDEAIDSFVPDYSEEFALVEDPAALVDHLDVLLTGGRLGTVARDRIVAAVTALPVDFDDAERSERFRNRRVELAIFMVMTSDAYLVQD